MKITGVKNKGGMILTGNIDYYDKEILCLVGIKGIKHIIHALKEGEKERKSGFMGYPVQEVFNEMREIVDEARRKQYGI